MNGLTLCAFGGPANLAGSACVGWRTAWQMGNVKDMNTLQRGDTPLRLLRVRAAQHAANNGYTTLASARTDSASIALPLLISMRC